MYISIKKIKYSLMIFACIFFAGINYLSYVKADVTDTSCNKSIDSDCDGLTNAEEKLYGTDPTNPDTDGDGYSDGVEVKSGYDPTKPAPGDKVVAAATGQSASTSNQAAATNSLTDTFTEELKTFVTSKGTTSVSNSDVADFVSQNISDKTGSHITLDTLPEIDPSSIKILPQNYSSLSESERKNKMRQDALTYYSKISYILASNAPNAIITTEDFRSFLQDFSAHYVTLASTNPDIDYFSDLGKRFDLVLEQIGNIEVPESLVTVHTKALRIVMGFLSLRDTNLSMQDPLSKMAFMSKIQDLTTLATDFFTIDFQNYNNSLR